MPKVDNYKDLNNISLDNFSFQSIKYNKNIEDLSYIFEPLNSSDENTMQLYKFIELPFNDEATKILTTSNQPVWNRYNIKNGVIDIFGFSLELNSTNFPIKGSFIPFMNYLLYSNSSLKNNVYKSTNNKWLYKSDEFANTLFHYLPNGKKIIINNMNNMTFETGLLEIPGQHSLGSKNEKKLSLSVNIDQREFSNNNTSFIDFNNNLNNTIQLISYDENIKDEIIKAKRGQELWRYILYLILILISVEMIISNDKKRQ